MWGSFEDRLEVVGDVALACAEGRSDSEGSAESDGESLGLCGLVDGRGDDEDLDPLRGRGYTLERRLRRGGADDLEGRDDVGLNTLLDRGGLGDNVFVTEETRNRLGLDLGRWSQSINLVSTIRRGGVEALTHTWRSS